MHACICAHTCIHVCIYMRVCGVVGVCVLVLGKCRAGVSVCMNYLNTGHKFLKIHTNQLVNETDGKKV